MAYWCDNIQHRLPAANLTHNYCIMCEAENKQDENLMAMFPNKGFGEPLDSARKLLL